MKYLFEYLRTFAISFEFICIILGICFGIWWQEPIVALGARINSSEEILKYLSFVPLGLGVWCINQSRKLLFPDHNRKEVLHQWPNYWKLRVVFNVTFTYSCLFAFAGLITWFFKFSIKNPHHLSFIIFSILGSLSVTMSVYWARVNLDEIMIKIKH